MIAEDYVSYETAKLLKEKGFDAECKKYYNLKMLTNLYYGCEYVRNRNLKDEDDCIAPSLGMVMKWLREKYNKIIVPGISLDDQTSSTISHYIAGIWYIPENNGGAFCYTSPTPYGGYPSFEEACEAGIRYCLENLI